jgi:plastocyanin
MATRRLCSSAGEVLVTTAWRRVFWSGLVAAALCVPFGAGIAHAQQATPLAAAPVKVSMKSFAFSPVAVHVPAGGTVQWTYDEAPTDIGCESPVLQTQLPVNCPGHSTTAVGKGADGKLLWDSGVHRADGFPYSHVFTTPGTYHYICTIHGGANANNPVTHMEGDVIVDAAAAPAPPPAGPGAGSTGAGVTVPPAPTVLAQGLARTGGGAPVGTGLVVLTLGLVLGRAVRRRGGSAAARTRAGG